MIKLRYFALVAGVTVGLAAPAAAQTAPGGQGGAAPGTGNGAATASANREENASYNSVIGKVGSNPVAREKARQVAKAKPVPAAASDVVAGAAVRDSKGVALGKIESIDGDSAVLDFATGKIRFPLIGFGKDQDGLLINLTTKDFLALVAKAQAGG